MTTITETLKKKIDELDLDRRFNELSGTAEKALKTAVEKAGEFAHERGDDIASMLDKAEGAVNQRTEGKYADKVTKVKATVQTGVEKLAEKRTGPTGAADDENLHAESPLADAPDKQPGFDTHRDTDLGPDLGPDSPYDDPSADR